MTSNLFGDQLYQAAGMVAVQLDCALDEAINRIIIRPAATGVTTEGLALNIIDRVIRFSP